MKDRLSPSEYIFIVAPLEKPFDMFGLDWLPDDLYAEDSKWFFVESVALTNGGGSYQDRELKTHIASVGTSVSAAIPTARGQRIELEPETDVSTSENWGWSNSYKPVAK